MKKSLAIVLSVLMFISIVLTGCGGKDDSESKKESNKTNSTVEDKKGSDSKEDSAEAKYLPGRFPLTEEKKSFSVMMAWSGDTPVEDVLANKRYQELTNVEVEWNVFPRDAWSEKRSIAFASGDVADVVAGMDTYNLTQAELMQYGTQGLLLPLNDLIDSSSVYFKDLLNKDPMIKKLITTPDGYIYALPNINVCYHCNNYQKMWINTEWLDNLGLDMPTTTAEFKDVLLAFKEQDANGNGDPNDELPLMTSVKGWGQQIDGALMNSFIYSDATNRLAWAEGNKVIFTPVEDGFRDGLRYLNDLFESGVLPIDAFTNDSTTNRKLNEADPAIARIGAYPYGYQAFASENEKKAQYEIMPPLKGPNGFSTAANFQLHRDVTPGAFAITANAKDPELIMSWLDWFYSEEGTLFRDGIEGTHYRAGEEGELDYNGNQAKYATIDIEDGPEIDFTEAIPRNSSKAYREMWAVPQDLKNDIEHPQIWEVQLFRGTDAYAAVAPPSSQTIPPLAVEAEDVAEYTRIKSEIETYVNESVVKFVIGTMSIDDDWDSYINTLNKMGLEKYLELSQESYDSFMK